MVRLFDVRRRVNESIEPSRAAGKLGKSLDAAIQLTTGDADSLQLLTAHRDLLPELFIVSQVEVTASADADGGVAVSVRHAQELGYHRCPRCWRWVPQLCTTPHGEVCPRCSEAL
jgi:isoleucyl-tRNA synthetase